MSIQIFKIRFCPEESIKLLNMSIVKVIAHPETGKVFNTKKKDGTPFKDGFGKIAVQSIPKFVANAGGFARAQKRTAFLTMTQEDFNLFGFTAGSDIEGKIVRKTSPTPFWEGQTPVMNPQTGDVVLHEKTKAPYYINDIFTDDLSAQDEEVIAETRKVTIAEGAVAGAKADKK